MKRFLTGLVIILVFLASFSAGSLSAESAPPDQQVEDPTGKAGNAGCDEETTKRVPADKSSTYSDAPTQPSMATPSGDLGTISSITVGNTVLNANEGSWNPVPVYDNDFLDLNGWDHHGLFTSYCGAPLQQQGSVVFNPGGRRSAHIALPQAIVTEEAQPFRFDVKFRYNDSGAMYIGLLKDNTYPCRNSYNDGVAFAAFGNGYAMVWPEGGNTDIEVIYAAHDGLWHIARMERNLDGFWSLYLDNALLGTSSDDPRDYDSNYRYLSVDSLALSGINEIDWIKVYAADSGSPPSIPTNVIATNGTYIDRVGITWNVVSGATYYEVYRASSSTGSKSKLASPTGTSHDDYSATVGTTYYYWVKACNTYGCSDYSSYNTGYRAGSPPGIPTNVIATNGTYIDRVGITWNPVSGATYYEVYRADSANGVRTRLGNPSGTTFDDTTTIANAIYYYWVKACNNHGCSDYSISDTGYRTGSSPGIPTNVLASDGAYTDRVRVTWNSVVDATVYEVHRATSSGGSKTRLGSTANTSFDAGLFQSQTRARARVILASNRRWA